MTTETMKSTAIGALGIPLLATLLFAGAGQAQTNDLPEPGMLPDHPLYFAKSAAEGIGTFFTFGDANEAERALELSEKRLAEARALADQDKPEAAEKAVERYQEQLDRALAEAEEARAKGEDTGELMSRMSEATRKHQAVLADVYERVPEQARPGIERAMEASRRGHERANEARSGARGRPDAPGQRPGQGRRGPDGQRGSDSAEAGRQDTADRTDRGNRGRGQPDSAEAGRPDTADRSDRGDRGQGRPDSTGSERPDGGGGR